MMELPSPASSPTLLASQQPNSEDNKEQLRLQKAAEGFEGAFLKLLLKSMRDTIPEGGIFDRQQMAAFEEMRDGALADSLANRGATGIAQMVVRQLGGEGVSPQPLNTAISHNRPPQPAAPAALGQSRESASQTAKQRAFIDQLLPAARRAAKALGIDATVIVAQAALETGWGQHIPKTADGSSSNNLFGVKADNRWQGNVTEQETTEFLGGRLRKVVAQFRAYGSAADSVSDYVRLISSSKRYAPALNAESAAQYLNALEDGGYATDPNYAEKIQAIINSPEMSTSHGH